MTARDEQVVILCGGRGARLQEATGGVARHAPAGDDAGGDRDPPSVADEPDRLALAVEVTHQGEQPLVHPQRVGPVAARDHEQVQVAGRQVAGRALDHDLVAPLARQGRAGLRADDLHFGAGLAQTVERVQGLDLLVAS